MDTAFIASTGNTQGIRFSTSPPRKASNSPRPNATPPGAPAGAPPGAPARHGVAPGTASTARWLS